MIFYLYILYSLSSDKYYVGTTDDPEQRLWSHNHSERKTFSAKHRPWKMAALFELGNSRSEAVKLERWLKRQKSRRLIEQMIDPGNELKGELSQLVRVPYVRD